VQLGRRRVCPGTSLLTGSHILICKSHAQMNNHSCWIYTLSQIGSTEWAEENMDTLASRAIAYLNVDISVFGPGGLMPRATPQLDELIKEASKMVFKLYPVSILQFMETPDLQFSSLLYSKVPDPDEPSQTLYDTMMRHHPPVCMFNVKDVL
jgi:hypothetical protein